MVKLVVLSILSFFFAGLVTASEDLNYKLKQLEKRVQELEEEKKGGLKVKNLNGHKIEQEKKGNLRMYGEGRKISGDQMKELEKNMKLLNDYQKNREKMLEELDEF
jgi:hypothetical protein